MKKRSNNLIIFKTILGLAILSATSTNALQINQTTPYIVKKGDTLWDISEHFLKDPWEWKTIWKQNSYIKNPDLIYPDDLIVLSYKDGKPYIYKQNEIIKTINLTENTPKKKILTIKDAIPPVNIEKLKEFNNKLKITNKNLNSKILNFTTENIIARQGDIGYAKIDVENNINDEFFILNKKENIKQTNLSTYEIIGKAKIIGKNNELSKIEIIEAKKEIKVNDNLLIDNKTINNIKKIHPSKPNELTKEAKVIYVYDKINGFDNDIVIIDAGLKDGVVNGNIFSIFEPTKKINDGIKSYKINGEYKSNIFIYKTLNNYSYGIIINNKKLIHVNDKIKDPFETE